MSVFKPATSYRWLGNVKKYKLTPHGEIRDLNDECGGDPNNRLLRDGTESYWSDTGIVDGADAEWAARQVNCRTRRPARSTRNLKPTSGTLTDVDLSPR